VTDLTFTKQNSNFFNVFISCFILTQTCKKYYMLRSGIGSIKNTVYTTFISFIVGADIIALGGQRGGLAAARLPHAQ